MNFKEHATTGVVTGLVCGGLSFYLDWDSALSIVAGSVAFGGANFPDLDTKSTPTLYFARLSALSGFFGIFSMLKMTDLFHISLFFPALILCLAQSGRHRGWTHSYLIPFVVVGLGMYSPSELLPLPISFALGLITHYALDKMNPLKLESWKF